MIKLKNVDYQIDQKVILQSINLNIEQGRTTVIMGKNGSGKSTLLKLLNHIIQPTSGPVSYTHLTLPTKRIV